MQQELITYHGMADALKGLPTDKFDAHWRAVASVQECSIADVDSFISSHYLRCRPAVTLLCLRMCVRSHPVGMVVYSAPPKETEKRYGGTTWELARLYLIDELPRNAETWLIAQSVAWIRKHRKEVRCLVSYADPSAGHQGTIYKAANWKADGSTDAERITPRVDYVDTETGKKYGRRGNIPEGVTVTKQPRQSKHRFVMMLKTTFHSPS